MKRELEERERAEQEAMRKKVERFRENRRKAAEAKKAEAAAGKKGTAGKLKKTAAGPVATTSAVKKVPAENGHSTNNSSSSAARGADVVGEAVKDESMPQAAAVSGAGEVELVVKTSSGSEMKVRAPLCGSVLALKEKIAAVNGCSVESQTITFAGRILEDSKSLESCGVQQDKPVYLVVRSNKTAATSSSSSSSPNSSTANAAASTATTAATSGTTTAAAGGAPSGSVLHLENGADQLQAVLSACGATRACVVDYSAPWCGPCRAIAPEFARLAREYPAVSFVHVDTEASQANAALARTAGIRAYPTFHVYRSFAMLESFSGANPARLASVAQQYSQASASGTAATAAVSSSTGTPAAGSGSLSERVMSALRTLKVECSEESEFVEAVRVLVTFVRNVELHPHESKYRRVRCSNANFHARLGSKPSGVACMRAFGFEETLDAGERYLVLSDSAAGDPMLGTVRAQLEAAIAAAPVTGAAAAAGGQGGNNESGANDDGDDEEERMMQQALQLSLEEHGGGGGEKRGAEGDDGANEQK
eukprot:CAMPEP_0185844626 /NCGR_PEP_ID=MMETSP1354-20130828/745_1 /TAXON_ID=708628 /ORGANISM="Erythrolobus madagascarensis, Strain CCMP3276" /LENGTH=536 /DNA_ID=CAMNT_0028544341 /DNA_START=8 /DNA_END=1618 /DNA_ORIENTATION=-